MARLKWVLLSLVVASSMGCQFGRYNTSISSDGPLGLPTLDVDRLPEQWEPESEL